MKHRLKAVWRIGTIILPICLVVVLATILVLHKTGNLPYNMYIVHTGSMEPTIPSGSAVLVHEGPAERGDVILFEVHHENTMHRWVKTRSDGLVITKGDANRTADPWRVPKGHIIGPVIAVMPKLGFGAYVLRTPFGLVAIVCAVICLWQMLKIGLEMLRERRQSRRAQQPIKVSNGHE